MDRKTPQEIITSVAMMWTSQDVESIGEQAVRKLAEAGYFIGVSGVYLERVGAELNPKYRERRVAAKKPR